MKGIIASTGIALILFLALAGCIKRPGKIDAARELEERDLHCAILFHHIHFLYREGERLRKLGRLNPAMTKYESVIEHINDIRETKPYWSREPMLKIEITCKRAMKRVGEQLMAKDLRVAEAIAKFSKKHAADADSAGPYIELANFYFFSEGDYNNAMKQYQEALLKDRGNVEVQINIARIYSRIGDYESAKNLYGKILKARPGISIVHYNLGGIYFKENMPTYAVREYTRALELNPDSHEAHNALGLVYKQLGQYDRAVPHFKNAILLNPNFASAYYNLGLTFIAKNNFPTGITYLNRAIEIIGPESPMGREIASSLRRIRRY